MSCSAAGCRSNWCRTRTPFSAGNPFYLREVVRALDRVAASDVELPATLAGVVERRLEQLTPRTRELLRASSILGEEFSIAIAARLLGRSVFGCLPDIDEAISAGALSAAAGTGCSSRTHWFVRPWSPGCRCENRSVCTAGRSGQSSSSTPIPAWPSRRPCATRCRRRGGR